MKKYVRYISVAVLLLVLLIGADYMFYQQSSKSLMLKSFDCASLREYDPLAKYAAPKHVTVKYPFYLKLLNPQGLKDLCFGVPGQY